MYTSLSILRNYGLSLKTSILTELSSGIRPVSILLSKIKFCLSVWSWVNHLKQKNMHRSLDSWTCMNLKKLRIMRIVFGTNFFILFSSVVDLKILYKFWEKRITFIQIELHIHKQVKGSKNNCDKKIWTRNFNISKLTKEDPKWTLRISQSLLRITDRF